LLYQLTTNGVDMKLPIRIAAAIGAALGLTAVTALGQPAGMGPGMMHGMKHGAAGGHSPMTGMLTKQDAGSAADMDLVHDLVKGFPT